MTPEERAREKIDEKLEFVAWKVQDRLEMDMANRSALSAARPELRAGA